MCFFIVDEVKAQTIDKIGSDVYLKSKNRVSNLNDITIRPIKFAVKELTPKYEQIDTQIMPEAMFLEPELINEISQKHAIGDENIPDINDKVTHQNQDRIIDTNNGTKETTKCNINSEQRKSMPVTRMEKSLTPKQETKEISESNSQQMMDGTVTANLSLNGDFHESEADRSTCEEDTEINKNYLQSQVFDRVPTSSGNH